MIPNFEVSGVLPPFLGCPTQPANQAPYKVTLDEFVSHFSTSDERKKILEGFLEYRVKLKSLGVNDGFQWLDGSFVEDVEKVRGRPPNDIDLVTFAFRPSGLDDNSMRTLMTDNSDIFFSKSAKVKFSCDAYFVDLTTKPKFLVSQSRYWFGLFSHQRSTSLWKGMLEVDLTDDENPVIQKLKNGDYDAS